MFKLLGSRIQTRSIFRSFYDNRPSSSTATHSLVIHETPRPPQRTVSSADLPHTPPILHTSPTAPTSAQSSMDPPAVDLTDWPATPTRVGITMGILERDRAFIEAMKERDGGIAGVEMEDGEVEGLRKAVKGNMFRVI
ncbi:hypothetical protein M427DRAFT_57258 [Gonapodya prolifera JEL478]|uniref:Uncharacterized protein n=1 Tax=Gonapodya prolifera (strain JEL478) TaxID=1344416 RepID=A0A139AEK4_GONPJ|nr:hypothetical protein M427DRAFT_57258 [Gonapodya prolifera JEL478]|eukprot:KXS14853.1 hypothetical protein M427DRAFT_57258 [Gonapodya prolifera JEL478]